MAIVVDEVFNRSGELGPDLTRRYTRKFHVYGETLADRLGPKSAISAVGIAIGSQYVTALESDYYAFCNGLKAEEENKDDGLGFYVTASYGPWVVQFEDPTYNPVEISTSNTKLERVVDRDVVSGAAIVNSAKDPFDPPVTADDSRLTLTFVRNEYSFDEKLADAIRDTVNDATWRGYDAGTVKADAPEGERQYSPFIGFYWRVTYRFEVNREGWTAKVLDAGLRQLNAAGNGQLAIYGKDNHPVSSPALLDGSGKPLAIGADPVFLEFHRYTPIDFTVFNLDNV